MELAQEAVDGAGTGSEMQILASRIKGHVYSPVEHGRYGRVHMKLRELGKVLSSIDGEIERTAGMLDDGVGHLSEHLALCADRRFRQKGRHFCQKAKPEASRVCRCESEPLGEHDSCHDSEMHEGELWIAPACKDSEVTLFLLKDRISETDKIKAGKLISNNYVPNTSHTKGPYRCTSNSPESIQVNLNIRIGMEDDSSPTKRTGKCPSTASAFAKEKRGWTLNSAGYLLGPRTLRIPDENVIRTVVDFLSYLRLKEMGALDDLPSSEEGTQP
ncbi:Galanin peptide [Acipenser ruthenus]|uniref:Galanin peptides n=1 Tax=Acipenser ruthenus TaxID=7906 RepID=A0A662Z2H8_ACIRT|nr:Galanin peptide [Acipenser ruthenus]